MPCSIYFVGGPLTILSVTVMLILCILATTSHVHVMHAHDSLLNHTNAFSRFQCTCSSLLLTTIAAALIAIAPLAPVKEKESASNLNTPSNPETLTPTSNRRLSPVLVIESFQDTTILILIASAAISLCVGIYENPQHGWVEGAAIIVAILVVAFVTSFNNFEKEVRASLFSYT